MINFITLCLSVLMAATLLPQAQTQDQAPDQAQTQQAPFANVEIQTIQVDEGLYMLMGYGGNIGISSGEDGIFMIDDQFAPLTPKILAAIAKISPKPVKFLINTHWHADHTGGNMDHGKNGTIIVAHDNVYKRLTTDQFVQAFNLNVPASPKIALPVVSFSDTATFHMNGLHIQARHYAHAHTDGDSIIFFKNINAVHMGDIFWNGLYPLIDSGTGGSIYGMIDATAKVLKRVDEKTKIIPGHGPLANKDDLQNFHDMLVTVVEKVTPLAKKGLSLKEATAQDPLKELNATWGNGILKPDHFLSVIYQTIVDHNS